MERSFKYRNILEIFIIFSVILLVFFYDYFNSFLGFYDEFFSLFSFIIILNKVLFNKKLLLYKREIYITISLFFLLIIGLLSNYHSHKLGKFTDGKAIIGDIINFYKAFAAYFGIRFLAKKIVSRRILIKLSRIAEIAFYILIVFLVLDFIFDIFPQFTRFGIHSYQLFFTHTSRFSFAFIFIFLILFPKYFDYKNYFLVFVLILGLFSLRVKYFAFFIISIILIFYGKKVAKIPRKTLLAVLGFILLAISLFFKDHILMYFSLNTGWSRGEILATSFKIGNDFFPFGTGFGSFSSYFSGRYYSWVYEAYGIQDVYGISKVYWGFIADQFWPMVLGQFGYFGLLAFLLIVYNFLMLFIINIKKSSNTTLKKRYMYSALFGLLFLIIDSSSDAIFTQNRAVVIFILFGLFVNSYNDCDETNK